MTHQPPYLPWYLDTCNEREIIVKDSRGNTVHYEHLAFPSEWSGSRINETVIELRANAMAMVEWSEKIILSEHGVSSPVAGGSSLSPSEHVRQMERDTNLLWRAVDGLRVAFQTSCDCQAKGPDWKDHAENCSCAYYGKLREELQKLLLSSQDGNSPATSVSSPTIADFLAWLKAKPGASYVATERDVTEFLAGRAFSAKPASPVSSVERDAQKDLEYREAYKAVGAQTQNTVRELLYCWGSESLDVLVPKKRGAGFLAVPWGHHANKGLSHIEQDLRCDISGLDGYLWIDCGLKIACYPESRAEFARKAMEMLSKHYGVPAREIGKNEFFGYVEKTQSVPIGNAVLPPTGVSSKTSDSVSVERDKKDLGE